VTFAQSLFVAVGDSGTVYTSTNAQQFMQAGTPTNDSLNAVAFGSGVYVAVGQSGRTLSALDGVSWNQSQAK
jgi:hypothetical protein